MSGTRRGQRTRESIAEAAHALFVRQGFNETSYGEIAQAAGRERTLVQYHFARKLDLVEEFLAKLFDRIGQAGTEHGLIDGRRPVDVYVLAQIYFAFLLRPSLRTLTLDIVSSLDVTDIFFSQQGLWTIETDPEGSDLIDESAEETIRAASGAHALIHHYLRRGQQIDLARLARRTVVDYLEAAAPGQVDTAELLSFELPGALLETISADIESSFVRP